MSVFLTPDLKPFYGGTYYPPVDSRGMHGFPHVLRELHRAWIERRGDVDQIAGRMTEQLQATGEALLSEGALSATLLDQAARRSPVRSTRRTAGSAPHPSSRTRWT